MELEKDYFRKLSPAEVIARVSTIGLSEISRWGDKYLRHVGWLDNLIIDKLYTITSAGQWIARTDTSGRIATVEQYSLLIHNFQRLQSFPRISSGLPINGADMTKRIGTAGRTFLSNAGGTLDADMPLIAANATYYGVGELLSIRASQNVAAGGTLVIQNGAGVALTTITLPALVANTPLDLRGLRIFSTLLTVNSLIYIDTTSANLGNATTFTLEYDYWYEV